MDRLPPEDGEGANSASPPYSTDQIDPSTLSNCPDCDGRLQFDDGEKEVFCTECGLVVVDNLIDPGPEWRSFSSEGQSSAKRTGPAVTPLFHDRGISSEISKSNRDAYGNQLSASQRRRMKRIRRLDNHFSKDGSDESISYGNGEIRRMGSKIGVPKNIQETAASLFRQSQSQDLLSGRSIEAMSAGCLYISLRVHNETRPLNEIVETARVDRRDIHRSTRYIIRELDLALEPVTADEFIPKFASELSLPSRVEQTTMELYRDLEHSPVISGRSPTVLAASAIYASSILNGQLLTQEALADATNVTTVSVRKNYPIILDESDSSPLSSEEIQTASSPRQLSETINENVRYLNTSQRVGGDAQFDNLSYPHTYESAAEIRRTAPKTANPLRNHVPAIESDGVFQSDGFTPHELSFDEEFGDSDALPPDAGIEVITKCRNILSNARPSLDPIVIDTSLSLMGVGGPHPDLSHTRDIASSLGGALYIATLLTQAIHDKNFSQQAIADIVEVSTSTVSNAHTDFLDVAIWLRDNEPPFVHSDDWPFE